MLLGYDTRIIYYFLDSEKFQILFLWFRTVNVIKINYGQYELIYDRCMISAKLRPGFSFNWFENFFLKDNLKISSQGYSNPYRTTSLNQFYASLNPSLISFSSTEQVLKNFLQV